MNLAVKRKAKKETTPDDLSENLEDARAEDELAQDASDSDYVEFKAKKKKKTPVKKEKVLADAPSPASEKQVNGL